MNIWWIWFGEVFLVYVERRMFGKSLEFICGWLGKVFGVKFVLIIFIGLLIFLVLFFSLMFILVFCWCLIEFLLFVV